MTAQPKPSHISFAEYEEIEERTGIKHEYYRGVVTAMTGASVNHNRIVRNVLSVLHRQLSGKSCEAFPSDLRVKVEETGLYTYPDITVFCGQMQLDTQNNRTALNPTVIIEVLSPSTQDYDRGTKFMHYRTIESLQEYILIAQDKVHVEHHVRQENGRWLLIDYVQMVRVELPSIDCTLDLAEVYERIEFPEPAPPPQNYEPD